MKNTLRIGAVAASAAIALAACSAAPEETPSETATETAEAVDYKACMVSDSGGFDDASFNQAGYEGLQAVSTDLGIEIATAESEGESDFAPNINEMINQGCDLTITVGFLLSQATVDAALANPDSSFAIIDDLADNDFDGTTDAPNIKPITFDTDEAAFLAGYAAAAASQTGVIGTFGGIQIPSVTIFMDGLLAGVNYYNEQNGAAVTVLGWDGETGSFTGDFSDTTKGQSTAQGFIDQGADVILPVAGPVGLGAAAAAQAAGNVWIIGVDSDWTLTAPDYSDIILTSVMKNMGPAVYDVVSGSVDAEFDVTPYLGTLENEGVGISDIADGVLDDAVIAEIEEIQNGIIGGSISVTP